MNLFVTMLLVLMTLPCSADETQDSSPCKSVYGYDGSGGPEYIVLDGQQRLTAMY